jgi:hypothetical protein
MKQNLAQHLAVVLKVMPALPASFSQRPCLPACLPPACLSVHPQSLYRGHASHVVFLGFLPDASLISVDAGGCLAQWPASAAERCGFGWLTPRKRWQLPHSTRTCQPR